MAPRVFQLAEPFLILQQMVNPRDLPVGDVQQSMHQMTSEARSLPPAMCPAHDLSSAVQDKGQAANKNSDLNVLDALSRDPQPFTFRESLV